MASRPYFRSFVPDYSEAVPAVFGSAASNNTSVPAIIKGGPIWAKLLPHIVSASTVSESPNVAVVRVVTTDGKELAVKAVPAHRAREAKKQVAAEFEAAATFKWDPLMAMVLAAATDSEGNVCSVQPFAGTSLANILESPHWAGMSQQDRLAVVAHMMACLLKVQAKMLRAPSGPRLFRDTKPDNIVYHPATGLWKCVDCGLMCRESLEDYHHGISPDYVTPEIAELVDGLPFYYLQPEWRRAATNATMDVFLLALVGVEALFGVQAEQQRCSYPLEGLEGLTDYLRVVGSRCFDGLLVQLPADAADFFAACLCKDPQQRFEPEEALQHPFLAGIAAAVDAEVAAVLPGYVQANQQALELLSGLAEEGGFVARQDQLADDEAEGGRCEEGWCSDEVEGGSEECGTDRHEWQGEAAASVAAAAEEVEVQEQQGEANQSAEIQQLKQQLAQAAADHNTLQQLLEVKTQEQEQQCQEAAAEATWVVMVAAAACHQAERQQLLTELQTTQQLNSQQAQQIQQLQLAAAADHKAAALLASTLQQLQALPHKYKQQGQELQCVQQQADDDSISVSDPQTPVRMSSSSNSSNSSASYSSSSSSAPTCSVPAAINTNQQQQQLAPPAMPAAAAPAAIPFTTPLAAQNNKKPNLLQRGVQLVKQLASSTSSSSKQAGKSKPSKAAAAAASTAHSKAAPSGCEVGDEACTAFVPGLCGLRLFGRSSRQQG